MLYGVMAEEDLDTVWTYEADSAQEAAAMYLDDPDCAGVVVRVWVLGRNPDAFVRTAQGNVAQLLSPDQVGK